MFTNVNEKSMRRCFNTCGFQNRKLLLHSQLFIINLKIFQSTPHQNTFCLKFGLMELLIKRSRLS